MLTIWGRADSFNVQKLLWCCSELELRCDRVDAGGGFGRTSDPAYLAKSPTGLVPLLEVSDGLAIWESNSSLRWLAGSHGPHLYPPAMAARAEIDCWMDWQIATLADPMRRLYIGMVRTPVTEQDATAINAARIDAARCWSVLETRLEARTYVTGEQFTLADICIAPLAYRWFKLVDGPAGARALHRWLQRISCRPAFKRHVERELS